MKNLFLITLFLSFLLPSFAQNGVQEASEGTLSVVNTTNISETNIDKPYYEGGLLSHLNVALRASTMGLGIEAATPLNSYLKLRAGINYLGFKSNDYSISLDDEHLNEAVVGGQADYLMNGKVNFTNGHLLVDFHPVKKGIFHLTVGAFVGTNRLTAKGLIVDANENEAVLKPGYSWPQLDFDGHSLDIKDGRMDATLQLGKTIKPYAGFGLGRSISRSRVSFKFEMGVIYQGDYILKQNGKKVDLSTSESESFSDIDDYTKWLKWWPMLNFQLTYRIF